MASSWRRSTNSRWLFSMPSVTSSRMRRRSSISPSASRAQASAFSRRSLDVERLEQLELALEGQVGRVPGGVGQGAGLVDGAQERGHAGVAAGLEDLLDDGAVLVRQLVRALADLLGVGVLGDLDAERLAGRVGAAEHGAVQRADGHAPGAARQHRRMAVQLGDDADAREAALAARDEHDVRGTVGAGRRPRRPEPRRWPAPPQAPCSGERPRHPVGSAEAFGLGWAFSQSLLAAAPSCRPRRDQSNRWSHQSKRPTRALHSLHEAA